MNTTTAIARCARLESHSLDEITGYVVVRTVLGWQSLVADDAPGDVLAVVRGANRYLQALNIAKANRENGDYAVVRHLHDCPACDPRVLAGLSGHAR